MDLYRQVRFIYGVEFKQWNEKPRNIRFWLIWCEKGKNCDFAGANDDDDNAVDDNDDDDDDEMFDDAREVTLAG